MRPSDYPPTIRTLAASVVCKSILKPKLFTEWQVKPARQEELAPTLQHYDPLPHLDHKD